MVSISTYISNIIVFNPFPFGTDVFCEHNFDEFIASIRFHYANRIVVPERKSDSHSVLVTKELKDKRQNVIIYYTIKHKKIK